MASIKPNEGNKWINATVILGAILFGYLTYAFVMQLGDWFDLEAKIKQFTIVGQGVAILFGFACWAIIIKNEQAKTFLDEVYAELIKVIWPDKDSVVKLTVGIVIGVTIFSGILVLVDLGIQELLSLFYSLFK